jgi:hypothetical protein
MWKVKPYGEGILKIRSLGWDNKRSPTSHFKNVPHPWALLIAKHETKFVMNQTYVDHKAYELEGSYAYS